MATEIKNPEPMIQTPQGLRVNPEFVKRIVNEQREGLALLAKDDGPVDAPKDTKPA